MGYGDPLASTADLYDRSAIDLLARMMYGEARSESNTGRTACMWIAKNRVARNSSEFGGQYYQDVILYPDAFKGVWTDAALRPDLSSTAWNECLSIAQSYYSSSGNPIGTCLWFNTNELYNSVVNSLGQYNFGSGYVNVTEKYVIGNHTFFKVQGY
ncbi:cell wall hydrolase [Desulfitobacterium sp.]|uniref:cell wall hydrolase n=1 Tax=Desulfitobacterium sp. TaxID=49981 RepID=UPI002C3F31B9|nr:cell wall hydrolase [Desulfitobacterium sp.]HVJ49838.1 cell wall hydrolase [Desulfitobacterium sp.]